MAIATHALPFGLREVVLTPINADGTEDTANAVKLPASRTFSFSETEEFEELQGDDTTVASHGAGALVEWELEGGGISLAVWKILAGGTTTDAGTTGSATRSYTKTKDDSRPYFKVEGRAISDNGGDFTGRVHYAKADGDLEANMENGSFLLTSASGKGYAHPTSGKIYDFVHSEVLTPLVVGTGE